MGAANDWLVGGGEMARLMREKDWSRTPLGPIHSWPQSLRTTVSLVQASTSPIALSWGPGHVLIYNDGYRPICGAKHPEALGQDIRECWASAFEVVGDAYASAWAGRSAYLEKMRMFVDRYGFLEETWFTFSFSPITDESGKVGGLFNPVTEMTGQMLSERRSRTLRDLHARTSAARTGEDAFALAAQVLAESDLDVPFALFYQLDGEGEVARLVAHAGVAPGTPVSPEQIVLRRCGDRPWPIAAVAATGAAREVGQVAEMLAGMTVGPHPELPRTAFALPISQPGSERPAAVMIAGMSSRLRLTEPYRAFYDILAVSVGTAVANARAYAEERGRAEALAELDRAKTDFFSNVSHEFRTPLTLLLGPIEDELAEEREPLPAARRQRLETAHRNGVRLLELVNALLDFSRIEAGRVQAHYEPTELAAVTAELASIFRSAVEKAGFSLTIDCPPAPEPLYVDRDMWEKIVLNLLANAVKHTFEGGIEVSLAWRGDHAELTVKDTGVGIPAAELPRLFERFHRVRGARARSHEGTGIGLALVQELARLHGGTVRVESQEGVGSKFTVTIKAGRDHLPAGSVATAPRSAIRPSNAAARASEALHATVADSAEPAEPGSRPRILLADDNADMREYLRRLLGDQYEVTAVADGAAALADAQERPPDLVLSDVMMPELDGFELLRELRADSLTRAVPVILLTARAGEQSSIDGLHAGADDYLVKPFSARELMARVRTHLELSRSRRMWTRELERTNQELAAFSYSVSHDLRAPLRAMAGFSQIVIQDHGESLDEHGRRYLQRIAAGAQKMGAMIDGLLLLSQIGRGDVHRAPIDLSDLAHQIVTDLRARDPSRLVVTEIAPSLQASGDVRLVLPLLENLLGNAWKFTAQSPEARIEFGSDGKASGATFFVRDNGAGFNMAYATKMFAPFQRFHRETEFEGTGIGLATVQRIVARHGGRVWAEAAVNQGAAFFFTLDPDS